MKNKHLKILQAVFENPVRANIAWDDIEKLLEALGAKKYEGKGSAVRFVLSNLPIMFHRPHPQKEAKVYQIKDLRNFLISLGVKP